MPRPDDMCQGFFWQAWDAGHVTFPPGASVLEIGCGECDWLTPMREARPDIHVVGVDSRGVQIPGALQADVMTLDWPDASLDAVVAISSVEHVGLGAYDDPLAEDGDVIAMRNAARWLKPGGIAYLDVPYSPTVLVEPSSLVAHRSYRRYDPVTLRARLVPDGLTVRWQDVITTQHPDSPYIALVLEKAA